MTRIGATLAAIALVFLSAAACGGEPPPSEVPPSESGAPTSPVVSETVDPVVAESVTPGDGPLPPITPAAEEVSSAELLEAARGRARAGPDVGPEPDVEAWIRRVRVLLTQAGFPEARLEGGAVSADVAGTPCRLLEARADRLTNDGTVAARFLRMEGGSDAGAAAHFDPRFDPFEAGGYFVRSLDAPGERAVCTDVHDVSKSAFVWQVGRVLVELREVDERVVSRIDEAARTTGLYADAAPPEAKASSGKDPDSKVEPEADLPHEGLLGDVPDADFQADVDIPSLGAAVKALRFYEGANESVPIGKREYRQAFVGRDVRYLWWELELEYSPEEHRRSFTINARWQRKDGTLYGHQSLDTILEPGRRTSRHTRGFGRAKPGTWAPGSYRLDLSVDDAVVASGTVEITGPSLGTATLDKVRIEHNHVVEGASGMLIQFELQLDGRLQRETHTGVYVRFSDGRPLLDFDNLFRDIEGRVATHLPFVPNHVSTLWKEPRVFFPYDQLHLEKGKHLLELQVRVFDPPTDANLASSDWIPLAVTQN